MACNKVLGEGKGSFIGPPDDSVPYTIRKCRLSVRNSKVKALMRDLQLLHDIAKVNYSISYGIYLIIASTFVHHFSMINSIVSMCSWQSARFFLQLCISIQVSTIIVQFCVRLAKHFKISNLTKEVRSLENFQLEL